MCYSIDRRSLDAELGRSVWRSAAVPEPRPALPAQSLHKMPRSAVRHQPRTPSAGVPITFDAAHLRRSSLQAVGTPEGVVEHLSQASEVIQMYRYPGLSASAAKTLLRKVRRSTAFVALLSALPPKLVTLVQANAALQAQAKVSDAITAIDGEQVTHSSACRCNC
jgi:hypothetical protein